MELKGRLTQIAERLTQEADKVEARNRILADRVTELQSEVHELRVHNASLQQQLEDLRDSRG